MRRGRRFKENFQYLAARFTGPELGGKHQAPSPKRPAKHQSSSYYGLHRLLSGTFEFEPSAGAEILQVRLLFGCSLSLVWSFLLGLMESFQWRTDLLADLDRGDGPKVPCGVKISALTPAISLGR